MKKAQKIMSSKILAELCQTEQNFIESLEKLEKTLLEPSLTILNKTESSALFFQSKSVNWSS